VYMEVMEITSNANSKPNKVWHRQIPRLYVGQYAQGVLECCGQSDNAPVRNQPKVEKGWLSLYVRYLSRMVSKIGTAVCRTARTVV